MRALPLLCCLLTPVLLAACGARPVSFDPPPRSTTAEPLRVRIEASGLEGVGSIDAVGRRQVLTSARSALAGLVGETKHFWIVDPVFDRVADRGMTGAERKSRPETRQVKKDKPWWRSLFGADEPEEADEELSDPATAPEPTPLARKRERQIELAGFPYRLRVNVDYLELQTGRQRRRFESVDEGRQPARNFPVQPIEGVQERYAHVAARTTVAFEYVDPETGLIRTIASARGFDNWNAPTFLTGKSAGSNTATIYNTLESSIARALSDLLSSPKIAVIESELRRADHDARRDLIEKYRRASAEREGGGE